MPILDSSPLSPQAVAAILRADLRKHHLTCTACLARSRTGCSKSVRLHAAWLHVAAEFARREPSAAATN